MTTRLYVFVSSKMVELAAERKAIQDVLASISTELLELRTWVFETDAPASNVSIRDIYLNALKQSALYIGLFWNEYGEWTIDEFNHATQWGIDRHIYVKNVDAERRDPQLTAFLNEQSDVISGITPKWFTTLDELKAQLARSVHLWLQDRQAWHPGDNSVTYAESPDDLPALPKRLIGRKVLLDSAYEHLQDGERVLLQGFGGMGKTALAATLAARWMDEGNGNVLWLRAGSEQVNTLASALARPFDAQAQVANLTGSAFTKAVRAILSESNASLLVLDDVWNGTALSELLKAVPRQLAVLVTARQRYALEEILEVGVLAPDEAVQLLGFHAKRDLRDDADARELCRQVGYHAFALEVAGKTLKVDRLDPADLVARVSSAPHLLKMPEDFAEEGRTSIVELLDASLTALDEESGRVFLGFGALFAPNATPDLLARYLDLPVERVESALTLLQRRGLAEMTKHSLSGHPYYHIHDLAYSYARAIYRERHGAPDRAITVVCDYASAYENDVDALDVEWSNLLGAAIAARQVNRPEALIAIARTLTGAYLSARGHNPPFLDLLDSAILAAETLGAPQDKARHFLYSKRANIFYDRGELEKAQADYERALELARDLEMEDREVILMSVIGKVLADRGEDAAPMLDAADRLARVLDDDYLLGFVLEQRGYLAQKTEDYAGAREIYSEEAELAERLEDDETLFWALLNLGMAERVSGDPDAAAQQHRRALDIAERSGSRVWVAHALQSLGEDYHDLGAFDQAQPCFERALELFRESGMHTKVTEIESFMKS